MNVKVVNASWDLKRVGRSPLAGKGGGKTSRGVTRASAKAVGREVVGLAKAASETLGPGGELGDALQIMVWLVFRWVLTVTG